MSMTCFVLFTFYLICGILLRPKDLKEDEEKDENEKVRNEVLKK
jgi:hypothetical protein